jgi:hypothetical protein
MAAKQLRAGGDYEIRVFGRTDAGEWTFQCDLVEKSAERVVLRTRTNPTHVIDLSPRHVGVKMDQRQTPTGETSCYFRFDGEAVSLATYQEYPRGHLVVPQDYEPMWVYEVPEAEQHRLASEVEAVRIAMGGEA